MFDWNCLPQALAMLNPKAPDIIFLDQPFGWIPILVGAAQTLLIVGVTIYIFLGESRRKTSERNAAWFHKVAVDPSIRHCFDYFPREVGTLEASAVKCEQLKFTSGDKSQLNGCVQGALQDFRSRLRPIRNSVSDLALIFCPTLRQAIFDRFNLFEDDVAGWFDRLQSSKAGDRRESLPNIVSACQSDVLKILKEYEFSHWRD